MLEFFIAKKHIFEKKKQSLIGILGITIGITVLMVSIGIANGLDKNMISSILSMGSHVSVPDIEREDNYKNLAEKLEKIDGVKGQLRPLQLVFRQFLRNIHPVGAHAHSDQRVVVPLPGGRYHADVHMDVRGDQLMEHILERAEILLDVPLDGFHLLLGVDLRFTGFLVLKAFLVRAVIDRKSVV